MTYLYWDLPEGGSWQSSQAPPFDLGDKLETLQRGTDEFFIAVMIIEPKPSPDDTDG